MLMLLLMMCLLLHISFMLISEFIRRPESYSMLKYVYTRHSHTSLNRIERMEKWMPLIVGWMGTKKWYIYDYDGVNVWMTARIVLISSEIIKLLFNSVAVSMLWSICRGYTSSKQFFVCAVCMPPLLDPRRRGCIVVGVLGSSQDDEWMSSVQMKRWFGGLSN